MIRVTTAILFFVSFLLWTGIALYLMNNTVFHSYIQIPLYIMSIIFVSCGAVGTFFCLHPDYKEITQKTPANR